MSFTRFLKQKEIPSAPADRVHPLEAVPLRADSVEERLSDRGDLHLRITFPPKNKLERFMKRFFNIHNTQQIVLDEKGAFFWKQIDGKQNLFSIRQALQNHSQLPAEESEESTVLFIKILMRRHFICMNVNPEPNPAS
jgi:hypothetical protein